MPSSDGSTIYHTKVPIHPIAPFHDSWSTSTYVNLIPLSSDDVNFLSRSSEEVYFANLCPQGSTAVDGAAQTDLCTSSLGLQWQVPVVDFFNISLSDFDIDSEEGMGKVNPSEWIQKRFYRFDTPIPVLWCRTVHVVQVSK